MRQTILLLSRHGETLENQKNIMQGHTPGTLSPLGLEQARLLGESLMDKTIDVVVSSDLARSYDTAKIVGTKIQQEPKTTPLLREIDWGEHTGGLLTELNWENLPEGSETLFQLIDRATRFLNWVKREYPGKTVLAIGHGAINRAIVAVLENKTEKEMLSMPIMKNTSVLTFEI